MARLRIAPKMAEDLSDASDAALVIAIGRYRDDALAEAYRRHAGAVLSLALRPLRDRALAEDVVQEVFLKLWNQPDRFDPARGTLRSFLLAQAHGRAVDIVRSETSRRGREDKESRLTAERGYDVEHEAWDLVMADHVREALGTISAGERKAIELAYFGGRTYREVAEILGQPEGTIKSRIRSGLRRLGGALVEAGVGAND